MAIDETFLKRIVAFGTEQGIFPGGSVAILGDCRFLTTWTSGDNRKDLLEFQRLCGLLRAETLDIGGNPTIHQDLHAPIPDSLKGQFDMVIDAGTMHCCFDVAQVWRNSLALLKPSGVIVHQSALTGYMGRAYYSINPLLFQDFYAQNGFEMLALEVRVPPRSDLKQRLARLIHRLRGRNPRDFHSIINEGLHVISADRVSMRFSPELVNHVSYLPNDALILCAASRKDIAAFTLPIPSYAFRQTGPEDV